jgi:hypothetical protein
LIDLDHFHVHLSISTVERSDLLQKPEKWRLFKKMIGYNLIRNKKSESMKRNLLLLFIPCVVFFFSCRLPESPEGDAEPPPTIVAIGDSTTMGNQDAGLLDDFQKHNYPYLVAQQLKAQNDFLQPYISPPGIGVSPYERPLEISNNQIIVTYWPDTDGDGKPDVDMIEIISRLSLSSLLWPFPYNNLGVSGATLFDIRSATCSSDSGGNYAFDIVLRNTTPAPLPNFGGMTIVEEAELLDPDIILLWIGNNDILGTVLKGCGTNKDDFYYTDPTDFETEYRKLLNDLLAITDTIVMANIPAYLPFGYALDGIYKADSGFLNVFHPETFEPLDFDPDPVQTEYIPLLLEESDAKHLLLYGALAYLGLDDEDNRGIGIPDDAALQGSPYNIGDPDKRKKIIQDMESYGLQPSGIELDGTFTMTQDEETAVFAIIEIYNTILAKLSTEFGVPMVDIIVSWWGNDPAQTPNPFGGYSGAYPIQDEENTTFSLDGVHINNLGHALSANAFIKVLNEEYQLGIPELNPEHYKGQYLGKAIQSKSLKAIKRVHEMYAPRNN